MSESSTLLLGFIAGVTIVLGLPIGRLRSPHRSLRLFLNAVAIGILLFLLWDVLSQGWEPVDAALGKVHDHTGGVGPVAGYGALLLGTLALAFIGLHLYEQRLSRADPQPALDRPKPHGPGALAVETLPARAWHLTLSAAQRLSLMIAIGIGLHNFGEGLAIGSSAARGEISVATVLVIGFALHNATEGFGIVAPLAAEQQRRPSWAFLALMGLIGGGPTFVGAAVGHQLTSDAANVAFMGLAAGSILYVVIQLIGIALRDKRTDLLYWGVLVGLVAGFVTGMIVTAGGA